MKKKLLFLLMIFSFILISCSNKNGNQNTKETVPKEESEWEKVKLDETVDFSIVNYLNTFKTKALMICVDKQNIMYLAIKDKEIPNIENGLISYFFDEVEISSIMQTAQKVSDDLYMINIGDNSKNNEFVELLNKKNKLIIAILYDDAETPYFLEVDLKGVKELYQNKFK